MPFFSLLLASGALLWGGAIWGSRLIKHLMHIETAPPIPAAQASA